MFVAENVQGQISFSTTLSSIAKTSLFTTTTFFTIGSYLLLQNIKFLNGCTNNLIGTTILQILQIPLQFNI